MMRRVEISTIFAVFGLVLLFILSSFVSPERVYLADLEKHEGDVVLAEGTIVDIDITSGGNTIMTLVDESGEGKIFAYGKKDVFVGDRVEVVFGNDLPDLAKGEKISTHWGFAIERISKDICEKYGF